MKKQILIALLFLSFLLACGGESEGDAEKNNNNFKQKVADKFGLTVYELDNGIGPIKEKLSLPEQIDLGKAKTGEEVFKLKCTQCHKLDERYTGPALGDVTTRRSPEYILNMMLNPEEMTKRHPEAKKLFAVYLTQMTFQNITNEDARNILEYFRSINK